MPTKNTVPSTLLEVMTIYKVFIPKRCKYVFMKACDASHGHSCGEVVFVNTEKFVLCWHNVPDFSSEYKLCDAEDGFLKGISDPVPLATVGEVRNGKIILSNGITRTHWLWREGAFAFPIYCDNQFVPALQELAGVSIV